MIGTGAVVPLAASCYTSGDGSVVGLPNPLESPLGSVSYGSGALPGGIYYIEMTYFTGTQETLPSPESRIQLTGPGSLAISSATPFPPGATGMRVYIGLASGGETLQGEVSSPATQYVQSASLAAGAPTPAANNSVCSIAFNDTIIPYSGYNVSLLSAGGSAYPGWPQTWQLNGGVSGTVNISNGAPLWNGVIVYPQPIVAQPLNHGPQSIAGSLTFGGFNVLGAGAVGVGTNTPGWPIDVENGAINTSAGYLYRGGAGTAGECLVSNGAAFVPGTCFAPSSTFYQTLASNGAGQPQEGIENFSSRFQLTDSPSTGATSVDLAASGVAAGSYTDASITINGFGQVTAATNGTALPTIQTLIINSGICTTGTTGFANCSFSVSWPQAFPNASYALTCTPESPTALALSTIWVQAKTGSGFTVFIQNADASGANAVSVSEIDCVGVHP